MRIPTRATMSVVLAGALVAACSGAAAPQSPRPTRGSPGRCDGDPAAASASGDLDTRTHPRPHAGHPACHDRRSGRGMVRGVETGGGLIKNYTHQGR